MPLCSCCGKDKTLEKFYYPSDIIPSSKSKQNRAKCRDCRYDAKQNRIRERRIAAFKHFGEKCADCGMKSSSQNYVAFDFHHLDPRMKDKDLDFRYSSVKAFNEELKKCILLCSNCHRLRHWKGL